MKKILSLLLCFSLASFGYAQQGYPVAGQVLDSTGSPMPGVTVQESGKNGTLTDKKGKFSLTVKKQGAGLTFSFIGYQTKKVQANTPELTVRLLPSQSQDLGDVVVIGTQVQSKRTTTAALSTVSGDVIKNLPSPSVDALLQGRVAGLNVQLFSGEPGVAPTVVVRGNSRINTKINDNHVAEAQSMSGPLYVIDGVPTNPEDIANNIDATGTNYLAGININDIESVDVQKDAAATAAWGSRGANGVIYITTRKGNAPKPQFRINAYTGVTQRPDLLKTYTGAEERRAKLDIINQYATTAQLENLPQLLTDSLNPYFNNATDWQGLFYQNGTINNIDATISAASEAVNYRVSMNYFNQGGIIKQFGYQRYALRGNFNFKISPKLNTSLIIGLSKGDRQRGKKYYKSEDNIPFSGADQPSSFYLLNGFDSSNFSGLYSKLRNKNINDAYNISFNLKYDFLPWLNYTFQGSANISTSDRDYFEPSNLDGIALSQSGTSTESYAESQHGSFSTYFINNGLNLIKRLETDKGNAHNLAITLSQQYTSDVSKGNMVSGNNTPTNDIKVVSGIPQSDLDGYSYYSKDAMLSLIGQVQYDFNSKYLLYLSYRGDASSRFGKNSKWGYFPAIGAGWIISDEDFMKGTKGVISFLKLRGSWGFSGTQSPNFYAPYNSYDVSGTYDGTQAIQPDFNNGLTKNDLTWTKTEQKNIGVDLRLFNSRISITADIYDKLSKDDYYDFALPFFTGFNSINFNARDLWVDNRGLDLTIQTRNLAPSSSVQWNSQLVLTYNKNAIAKLPNNNRIMTVKDGYGIDRIFEVGQPIYELYQMHYMGIYNHQNEIPFNPLTGNVITYFKGTHTVKPGDPIWQDVNGDGDVWTGENNGDQYGDRIPAGNPNPKFTGGFTNDITYKNFSLQISSVFTWKRTVVNTYFQKQLDGIGANINDFAKRRLPDLSGLDYWTPEKAEDPNYKAAFPSVSPFGGYFYQFWPFSDMWNVDGSYFKIKYVMLNYQLPSSITKRLKVSKINTYVMMENVLTIKNKHNTMPDPELVTPLGVYTGGLYPQPHQYTLGLNVEF